MSDYEGIFVVDPELKEEDLQKVEDSIKDTIAKQSGVVENVEKWGKKKLAYRINRRRDGVYLYVRFKADPLAISKMNKAYELNESILKTLIINTEIK